MYVCFASESVARMEALLDARLQRFLFSRLLGVLFPLLDAQMRLLEYDAILQSNKRLSFEASNAGGPTAKMRRRTKVAYSLPTTTTQSLSQKRTLLSPKKSLRMSCVLACVCARVCGVRVDQTCGGGEAHKRKTAREQICPFSLNQNSRR